MGNSVIKMIQENDPEYDPITIALDGSKITRELYQAACDRVYWDGYNGPLSDKDWEEQDGRKPYSVKEALSILEQVSGYIEDYKYTDTYIGEDEEGNEIEYEGEESFTVTSESLRREVFDFMYKIYGSLPW